MEPDKIESFETPTPPENDTNAGESPIFSLMAVLIMVLILIGGGYYYMHKTGVSKAVDNLNAQNPAR